MPIENPLHFQPEQHLPKIIQKVAKVHSIEISEGDLRKMIIVASACGIADDEVDRCQDPCDRRKIVKNAFTYLKGEEDLQDTGSVTFLAYQESMSYLKDVYDTLPEKKQESLMRRLRIWDKLSERQKETTDFAASTRARLVDLNVTAGIYLSSLPDTVRTQPEYARLLKTFKKMVRTAGILDDAMDMPDDFKNGITPIKPTLVKRVVLVCNAIRQGCGMLTYTFSEDLIPESIKIMAREYRRRKTENNYEQYNTTTMQD